MKTGDRPVLGTIGFTNPYINFVASADIDELH